MPRRAWGFDYCEPLPHSALAAVYYAGAMDYDGRACGCRIECFRAVLRALSEGKPARPGTLELPPFPAAEDDAESPPGDPPDAISAPPSGAEGEARRDDASGLSSLASRLQKDYAAAEIARAKDDADRHFPRNVSPLLAARLPRFPFLTWVILLCHGGYFAGGVFDEGRCVLHKAFQRYVVRKKQGGKQSSNAKDGGGSYHSAGSMIRAAQELEWRREVRQIIWDWQPYIDRAAFILHAAPGPQNLAMLTDFSSLPPPSNGVGRPSPIRTSDPRVQRVPITTHRPKYEEVQRIYDIVSQYNVVYVVPE
ncbi:unnamed protein product [Phytomonas sp. Hart1]|nr:unnamed protein product [Phytomonas sp. Hart1]|eukprot:CCW68989.1 unnamed protein product [Phytomonas sp. isolate Hart1]